MSTVANPGGPGVTVCVPSNDPLKGTLTARADAASAGMGEAPVGDAGALHPAKITKLAIPVAMNDVLMRGLLDCGRKSPVVSLRSA
jgi:hypothetical protein